MKAVRGLLFSSLVATLLITTLEAQDKPVFRASVNVIRLDVSVLDKDRKPIRDLTQKDFTILVDGVEQPIVAFSPVVLPPRIAPPAAWMTDVAPDVRSNDLPRDPRLFAIVMDDVGTPPDPWMVRTGKQIAAAIVNEMGPSDLAAIVFTLNGHNAQDFTADRGRLLRAIETFSTQGGLPMQGRITQDTLRNVFSTLRQRQADARASVMWISTGGMPIARYSPDGDDGNPMESVFGLITSIEETALRDTAREARVSSIPVYGFSIAGLMAPGAPDRSRFRSIFPKFTDVSARIGNDALRTIADASGGRAVVNTNTPAAAVPAIVEETSAYYVLGYRATYPVTEPKSRRLRVKVNRPDAIVYPNDRRLPPPPKTEKMARAAAAAPMVAAIADILPRRDLPMRINVAPFAATAPGSRFPASVAVTTGIHHPSAPGPREETVDVVLRVFTPSGDPVMSANQTATLRLNGNGTEGDYEVVSRLDLKPGRYQLRVSAKARSTDTLGSVYTDLVVPDFRKQALSLSGIALSATPALRSAPADALRGLLTATPTAQRKFLRSQHVNAFLRVYQGRSRTIGATGVRATITDASGKEASSTVTTLAPAQFVQRAADYTFAVPLASLPEGEYLLTLTATATDAPAAVTHARFAVK